MKNKLNAAFIKKEYLAFSKIIKTDCPYEIDDFLNDKMVKENFEGTLKTIIDQHSRIKDKWYSKNGEGIFDLLYMDHFLILCYRFSNALYKSGQYEKLAKAIFYSSKNRTSADIFYQTEIGDYFLPVHPIGTIIDPHSKFGKGLLLYEHVHIGPYSITGKETKDYHRPEIGDGVIIYGYSKIMGNSKIGDNVIISLGATIINKDIPSNSIVMMTNNGRLIVLPNRNNNLNDRFVLDDQ